MRHVIIRLIVAVISLIVAIISLRSGSMASAGLYALLTVAFLAGAYSSWKKEKKDRT